MNDSNLSLPSNPPPVYRARSLDAPLGEHPDDRVPITGPISAIEAILRQPRRMVFHLRNARSVGIIAGLLLATSLCALVYGLVVGGFSGGAQLWIAPAKVAGGLLLAGVICHPSLYIFSCLSGSPARLLEVVGLVTGLLALTTILLIGFAPVAWVFSQSTASLAAMGALHLSFWSIATYFGWRFLRDGFAHLSVHSNRALYVWIFLFVLVCVQMTTALRPILGRSDTFLPREKKFFVAHWFDVLEQSRKSTPAAERP